MNTTTSCPECSRPLPPDAPDALCPYCLLAVPDETLAASGRPRFVSPEIDELQSHFDIEQLQIVRLIGSGGMGSVYLAEQPRLGRQVAIKILPPELATSVGFDERFAREARVLARLDHSNIVDVHDFGKTGPYSYLILEHVDGVNLRDLISGGVMAASDALEIIPQLCDALQYAHDQGIVHRDVKPENILIDTQGRVKITDFGLAKLVGPGGERDDLTRTHQVMGTPNYMAPEQIEKPRHVDHRADIYALGVVFYELLTGELPLGRFSPPSQTGNGSRRLDKIVMKALEKEPDRRYEQASKVKEDVARAVGETHGRAAAARHAADFVADSASAAQESIAAFQFAPWAKTALLLIAAIASYACFAIAIASLTGPWLAMPLFVALGIAFAFFAQQLEPTATHPRWAIMLSQPSRWIADRCRRLLPATGTAETTPLRLRTWTQRDNIGIFVASLAQILAVLFFFAMIEDGEYFPAVVGAIIVAFAAARYHLRKRTVEELTTIQKWQLYPPILIVLVVLAVPLILSAGAIASGVLVAGSQELRTLVRGDSAAIPGPAIGLGIFLALSIQFLWMAVLCWIARWLRPTVRWVARPFLDHWDGRWMIVGSLGCVSLAIVCGTIAWIIAH